MGFRSLLAYFRAFPDGEGEYRLMQCTKEEATSTGIAFTDTLEDGTEFGLMVYVTEVLDGIDDLDPQRMAMVEHEMEKYRKEH